MATSSGRMPLGFALVGDDGLAPLSGPIQQPSQISLEMLPHDGRIFLDMVGADDYILSDALTSGCRRRAGGLCWSTPRAPAGQRSSS